jgi:DNA replication protein DnaC
MRTVATPGDGGYGWTMDDSKRLERAVTRRTVSRAPIRATVERVAARHGVDPEILRDTERADELLAARDREARQARLARQAEILLARLPAAYRTADFPRTDFGRLAQTWLSDYRDARAAGRPARSLVILGGTGTGKTWTACAIARALLVDDTVPVTVTTVQSFLESLKPAMHGLDVDMLQYTTAPVLVLDDLGSERLTEWSETQLHRLAHDRSHNNRPMIITSNLTGKQIRDRYDQRTVERLFGGAALIEIFGETRRPMPF